MATRKRYSADQKAKALAAVKSSSVNTVSVRTGIPKSRLYEWARSAELDEDGRDKVLIETHGADGGREVTEEMEAEAQAVVDLRRAEAELAILQDEYEALKAKYIDLRQTARSA